MYIDYSSQANMNSPTEADNEYDSIATQTTLYMKSDHELTIDFLLYLGNSKEYNIGNRGYGIIDYFLHLFEDHTLSKLHDLISAYNKEIIEFNRTSTCLLQTVDLSCMEKTKEFFEWANDNICADYEKIFRDVWPEMYDHFIRKYIIPLTIAETSAVRNSHTHANMRMHAHTYDLSTGSNATSVGRAKCGDGEIYGFHIVGKGEGQHITCFCNRCKVYMESMYGEEVKEKFNKRIDIVHFLHSLDPGNQKNLIRYYSMRVARNTHAHPHRIHVAAADPLDNDRSRYVDDIDVGSERSFPNISKTFPASLTNSRPE